MMTDEEKREVQLQTRLECARIAALESQYWGFVDDERPHMADICIGAMGACANVSAAIFMGKTAAQVAEDIESRDLPRFEEIENKAAPR